MGDMSLKLTIRGIDPKNFKFYKLRKFMYSLQPIINPENPRVDEKDHRELNKPVQIGNASHRKGFAHRRYFDDFVTLKIGEDVPEHLAEIRTWNERDEINGNWIQTWFKVDKNRPKKVNDITLISLHGELSSPYKGEFGFQMRVYYSYPRQALMFEDWLGQKKKIWSYKKYDVMNQWSFVTLLVRKIFENDETRFEVHAATSYEHIFKILYNADDEPEEDDDRVRRLKLVKGRSLDKAKSDESSVSNKDDNDPNSDKTQKKQADAEEEKKKDDDSKRNLKVDTEGLNLEDLRYAQIERELEHDYAKFPVRQLGAKNAKRNDKAEKQANESGGNSFDDEETKNEERTKEKEEQESRRQLDEEEEEHKGKKTDKENDNNKDN